MTSRSVNNSQNDNRSPTSSQPPTTEQVSFRDWVGVVAVCLAAFMSMFAIQTTLSAVHNMSGDFGVDVRFGAWIIYGYLTGQLLAIPIAGSLLKVFSPRRYFLVGVCLFIVATIATGITASFPLAIAARAVQGFTGGGLMATAMVVIVTKLPPAKRPIGLTLNSLSLALAPAIGPDVGGWITYNFSWHYVSYPILIPGILAFAGGYYGLKNEPTQLQLLKGFDWLGMSIFTIGAISLIYAIQIGPYKNWFDFKPIIYGVIIAAICFLLFIVVELNRKHPLFNRKQPLFNLRLFKQDGFALSVLVTMIYALAQGESLVILLFYLIPVQDYNALEIGKTVTFYGLPQIITTPFVPKLMQLFDLRLIVSVGMIGYAISFWMNVNTTSETGMYQLAPSLILRGLSQPLIVPALSSIVTSHAKKSDSHDASILFNTIVSISLTFGAAFLKFFQVRRAGVHSGYLNEEVSLSNPTAVEYIDKLTQYFSSQGSGTDLATNQAHSTIADMIATQSEVLGFIDAYYITGWIILSGAGLVFLIRKPRANSLGLIARKTS